MHVDQEPYRELHDAILRCEFEPRRTLTRWLERHGAERAWLETFRERHGPGTHASDEDLWRLYGLSRVLELLTLSFQEGSADGSSWRGPGIALDEWVHFAESLGLAVIEPERFSPFDCEIVTAAQAVDPGELVSLVTAHWPCLMLGDMMLGRAGTSVSGGAEVLNAKVAASSTLYWACRRKTRPYHDLSRGWGSNSQWRTAFRRDYRSGDRVLFNVDGKHDLAEENPRFAYRSSPDEEPLTRQERIELLVHRCFIITAKESSDLWPYNDKIAMSEGELARPTMDCT